MDRLIGDPRTTLEALVGDFDRDAAENCNLIRTLLEKDSEAFYKNALHLLRSSGDSQGLQYLAGLLASNGLLMRALCEPDLSQAEALALGRAAIRADPMADVKLAKELVDCVLPDGGSVQMPAAPRILEILAAI